MTHCQHMEVVFLPFCGWLSFTCGIILCWLKQLHVINSVLMPINAARLHLSESCYHKQVHLQHMTWSICTCVFCAMYTGWCSEDFTAAISLYNILHKIIRKCFWLSDFLFICSMVTFLWGWLLRRVIHCSSSETIGSRNQCQLSGQGCIHIIMYNQSRGKCWCGLTLTFSA